MTDRANGISARARARADQAKDVIPFEQNHLTPGEGIQVRIAEALERIAAALERVPYIPPSNQQAHPPMSPGGNAPPQMPGTCSICGGPLLICRGSHTYV